MRILAFAVLLSLFLSACSDSTKRPYRIPYVDGVEVTITADHIDHQNPPEKMFDIRATQPGQILAAAAPGWVREIKESGDSSASTNNFVWIEHPLDYCQPIGSITSSPTPPGECKTCPQGVGKCNEWTLYAHMEQNSVSGFANLSLNEWVEEGQAIGIESDVGFTPGGRHVHFAIFNIDRDSLAAQDVPSVNGDYEDYALVFGRPELVPLFCTAAGLRYPKTNDTHIAGPCPDLQ